jgi:transposase
MSKRRLKGRSYPPEFREQVVELGRSGRTAHSLAKEFGLSNQTVLNWLKQAEVDAGKRSDGLTTVEQEELKKLRREVKQLQLEREILSKAAAWFARETDVVPPKSSNS